MEEKRPRFRGWIHLVVLIALSALVAFFLKAEGAKSSLDPTGAYRLTVDGEYLTIKRVSDGAMLDRVATGGKERALAAWDPKRPACLAWLPSGGPAGSFWSWREGKSASIPLEAPQLSNAPWPIDGNLSRKPRVRSGGSPDWTFSPDGLRVAVVMTESAEDKAGLLLCVHPWQLPADPNRSLFDPTPSFHAHLDGVTSAAWKSLDAMAVETTEGPREINCIVGPSFTESDPDDVTPQLSPDRQYRLLNDGKTDLRVQRVSDQQIVWQLPARPEYWYVQPRWHEQKTLLAVNEMLPYGSVRLHVFTPEKQTSVDLGNLGGEGALRPPWPSPDGARVVVLIAPVFGHYDTGCGPPTCCHLADGKVHRLEPPPGEYQGLDREELDRRFPEATAGFYGVRRAGWTSATELQVWNAFGFEGSEYLFPSTRACELPAAAWP